VHRSFRFVLKSLPAIDEVPGVSEPNFPSAGLPLFLLNFRRKKKILESGYLIPDFRSRIRACLARRP